MDRDKIDADGGVDITLQRWQLKAIIEACRSEAGRMRMLRDRAKQSFKQNLVYERDDNASGYDDIASYLSEFDEEEF